MEKSKLPAASPLPKKSRSGSRKKCEDRSSKVINKESDFTILCIIAIGWIFSFILKGDMKYETA